MSVRHVMYSQIVLRTEQNHCTLSGKSSSTCGRRFCDSNGVLKPLLVLVYGADSVARYGVRFLGARVAYPCVLPLLVTRLAFHRTAARI